MVELRVTPVPTPEDVGSAQRRTVAVLAGAQVLAGTAVATGLGVTALLATEMADSAAIGGFAQTTTVVGSALVAMPLATIAARHGRRRSLATGYGLAAAGAAVAVLATTLGWWPLLMVGVGLFGAGSAAGLAARFAATDLADPARRGRDLSVVVWAGTIGSVAGPNIAAQLDAWAIGHGALLAGRGSHTAMPYVLAAVVFGLASLAVLTWLRPDPLLLAQRVAASPPAPRANPWRSLGEGWAAIRTSRPATLGLLTIAMTNLTMISFMVMTPVHMDHHGASLPEALGVISLHMAGMYGLSPVFGIAVDRLGARPVVWTGAALFAGAIALLVGAPGAGGPQLTAALVVLGLGWSAGLVAGSALVTAGVAPGQTTLVQGVSDVTMNVAGAVGGLLAGVVVSVWGFVALGGVFLVLLGLYAAGLVVLSRPEEPPAPPRSGP